MLNDDARQRDLAALAKLKGTGKLEHSPGKNLKAAKLSTKRRRFKMPEKDVSPGDYKPGKKNPIHSILTALPILMLVAGFYYHYSRESEQANSPPILAESISVQGSFSGLSELKSGTTGQHFLWLTTDTGKRGIRIQVSEVALFADLERGIPMQVDMAPTVSGSSTFWAWRVKVADQYVLERNE